MKGVDALALTRQSRLIRRRVRPVLTLRLPAALAGKTTRTWSIRQTSIPWRAITRHWFM